MYLELGLVLRPHQKSFVGAHPYAWFDDEKNSFVDETTLSESEPHIKYFNDPFTSGEDYFREFDIGDPLGVVVGTAEDKAEYFLESANLPTLYRTKRSDGKDLTTTTHTTRILKPLILFNKLQTLLHKAGIYHRG